MANRDYHALTRDDQEVGLQYCSDHLSEYRENWIYFFRNSLQTGYFSRCPDDRQFAYYKPGDGGGKSRVTRAEVQEALRQVQIPYTGPAIGVVNGEDGPPSAESAAEVHTPSEE
jgi:hypothetical protein